MKIKICKKHGELEDKDTYLMKTSSGNLIKMCSICKRGYKNDWAKLNPDKVKISQLKKREKRLKELENGTLKKICKTHGELTIDRIRIDTRGSLICKICDSENSKLYKNKDKENYLKRCKVWRQKNPDKMKQYTLDYRDRRKEVAKALYQKWKKDPIQRKKILNWQKKSRKKSIEELSDSYIKKLIKHFRRGHNARLENTYLKNVEVSNDLIEIRRLMVLLNRERRKRKIKDGN